MHHQFMKPASVCVGFLLWSVITVSAWHHHADITMEAMRVVPKQAIWGFYTVESARAAIARASLIPDEWNASTSTSFGYFFANDYLLFPDCPVFAMHNLDEKDNRYIAHFNRVLQAFRTESPENVCHRLGVLLHYVEDNCAPQHADVLMKNAMKNHFTEGWLQTRLLTLGGYQPQLLGKNAKEALAAFEQRLLRDQAEARVLAEDLLPMLSGTADNLDRSFIEPRQLRAAIAAAQTAADVTYTLLMLGTQPVNEGGDLEGTVIAPAVPLRDDRLARVMLLNAGGKPTVYDTLALAAGKTLSHDWRGTFRFRNLPAGTYRVAVYRLSAQLYISDPVTVKEKASAKILCNLKPSNPAGNLIENPEGALAFVRPGIPDRWYTGFWFFPKDKWVSGQIVIQPKRWYRMGAALKDPNVKVELIFVEKGASYSTRKGAPLVTTLKHGETSRVFATEQYSHACVEIFSDKPFSEIVEKIWLVPE